MARDEIGSVSNFNCLLHTHCLGIYSVAGMFKHRKSDVENGFVTFAAKSYRKVML